MIEKTINEKTYRIDKLDVFAQANLLSLISPFVSALAPVITSGMDGASAVMAVSSPMAQTLAQMTDNERNDIFNRALSCVWRKNDKGDYVSVMVSGVLAFDDIDLVTMLKLVGESLKENFATFFPKAAMNAATLKIPQELNGENSQAI